MLYHPSKTPMWDAWAIEKEGEYHLIHMNEGVGEMGDRWGHAVSKDMIHWEEKPAILPPTGTQRDAVLRYTGCTIESEGKYYTFYTMRAANGDQCIGMATSDDLYTWIDYPNNPVLEPDPTLFLTTQPENTKWLNVDCRDMFVIPAPNGGFYGYFVAVENSIQRRGVIGMARSKDLYHWTDQTIVYRAPGVGMVEMIDVYPWNGRYVMTMLSGVNYGLQCPSSVRGAVHCTLFAMADQPEGPFIEDKEDNLLFGGPTNSGFSCRSLMIGDTRRAIYIYPNNEDTYPGPCEPSLAIPKNVVANAKGHPTLTYAADLIANVHREALPVAPAYHPPVAFAWDVYGGQWRATEDGVIGETIENSWQVALLDAKSVGGAKNWEIKARFEGKCRSCGFVCYESETDGAPQKDIFGGAHRYYAITVHPDDALIAVSTIYEGDIITQRAIRGDMDGFTLRVIKVDKVLEVYLNDELMLELGTNLSDYSMPGYFVDNGRKNL